MRPISEVIDQTLVWKYDKSSQSFNLEVGEEDKERHGEILATLSSPKGSGSLMLAETADGRWTYKRGGFWHPHITLRQAGSDSDLAVFESDWNGHGKLTLSQERVFRWQSTNSWGGEWAWRAPNGVYLMRFKNKTSWTSSSTELTLNPAVADMPELSVLITLGAYIVRMHSYDAASTAVIVATT